METEITDKTLAGIKRFQHQVKATAIWDSLDANAKVGVRFGMFPAGAVREAQAQGFDMHTLCVELMACASRNGGMRA